MVLHENKRLSGLRLTSSRQYGQENPSWGTTKTMQHSSTLRDQLCLPQIREKALVLVDHPHAKLADNHMKNTDGNSENRECTSRKLNLEEMKGLQNVITDRGVLEMTECVFAWVDKEAFLTVKCVDAASEG